METYEIPPPNNKKKTFSRVMDVVRILLLLSAAILIYIIVTEIETIKFLGSDPCAVCMNKTGCYCSCGMELESQTSTGNEGLSCEGLGLEDTAECLVGFMTPYYNYTVTLDNYTRPLDDILENGGDCLDYSRAYVMLSSGVKNYTMYVEGDLPAHAYAVLHETNITSMGGYCILDQLNWWCVEYAEN